VRGVDRDHHTALGKGIENLEWIRARDRRDQGKLEVVPQNRRQVEQRHLVVHALILAAMGS
jgi:hypothetical protein